MDIKGRIHIAQYVGIFLAAVLFVNTCVTQLPIAADTSDDQQLNLESAPDCVVDAVEENILNGSVLSEENQEDLYSVTLDNQDGTKTRYAFAEPVKYKSSDNKVKFKNDKLKKMNKIFSSYEYENGDNTINTYFPKKIKDGILIETADYSIRFRPFTNKNVKASKKTVSYQGLPEEVVEYPGIFGAGTALQYRALMNGIKENIILEQYTGENTFQFYIDFGDLVPAITEGPAIILLDPKTGEEAAVLSQPDACDSYTGEYIEGESHYTLSNSLKLTQDKKGWILTVIIDKAFLESSTTVYPVIIDPTITVDSQSTMEDTTIYSNSNADYSQYLTLTIGYTDVRFGEGRVLNRFTGMASFKDIIPENILSAEYKMFDLSANNNPSVIRLYRIDSPWNQTTVNWNNCPPIGNFVSDQAINEKSTYYSFPITNLFQSWLRDYRATNAGNNFSFLLMSYNSLGISGSRVFGSSHWTVAKKPYFAISYHSVTEANPLENGVYYIRNQQSGKYLDIEYQSPDSGANVHQWVFHGEYSQQWYVQRRADGYYTIHPMLHKTRALTVADNYTLNESNVISYGTTASYSDASQWKLIYNSYGDSTYRMMSRASGDTKALVVQYASSDNGANVIQYDYSYLGDRNDDWVFERADVSLPTPLCVQLKSKWCWAACGEMLARTYNINFSRSQTESVLDVHGNTEDLGGTITEAAKVAQFITVGINYYSAENRIYSPNVLTKLLRDGYPVVISRAKISEDWGHEIVAYGFYYDNTGLLKIRYKDPDGIIDESTYTALKNDGTYKWRSVAVRNNSKAADTIIP